MLVRENGHDGWVGRGDYSTPLGWAWNCHCPSGAWCGSSGFLSEERAAEALAKHQHRHAPMSVMPAREVRQQ